MSDHNKRTDWSVFGAVALIALGVWLLIGQLPFTRALREAVRWVGDLGWPLALIALGVVILLASRRRPDSARRLYRSRTNRMVGGVFGGLAAFLGTDATWLRILYAVIAVISGVGPGLVAYLIAMLVIPEEPVAQPQQWAWPGQPGWPQPTGTQSVQPAPPPPAPVAPPPPPPPAPPTS